MDAVQLLATRRSCRAKDLLPPGPDAVTLEKLLAAGLRVPDHGKLGPWRVLVLQKSGQAALGAVLAEAFAADYPHADAKQINFERARPQRAPLLLVVSGALAVPHKIPEIEQILSGGALCQNLLNAAHALGFAGQWLTEWPAYDVRVKAALGLAPETPILGFIYIGTAGAEAVPRWRPSVAERVTIWAGPNHTIPLSE